MLTKVLEIEKRLREIVRTSLNAKGVQAEATKTAGGKEYTEYALENAWIARGFDDVLMGDRRALLRSEILEIERMVPIAERTSNPATHWKLAEVADNAAALERVIRKAEREFEAEDDE